jgi:hypothetical protein
LGLPQVTEGCWESPLPEARRLRPVGFAGRVACTPNDAAERTAFLAFHFFDFASKPIPGYYSFGPRQSFEQERSMKRLLAVCLLLAMSSVLKLAPAEPQNKEKEEVAKMSLKVGDKAPDFNLLSNEWKPVKLSDYYGKKNVFLAVYVLAFTGG